MIPAVAFAPLLFVEECFETLREHLKNSPFNAHLEQISDYFEDTYIGRVRANGRRRNPRFAHNVWNLNQLVLDGEPRTNNGIEAFNKQFAKNVGAAHPTIWKLIDAMRREVLLTEQR